MNFTQEELQFIEKELGVSQDTLFEMPADELLELADRCFDLELEGDLMDARSMPRKNRIASEIYSRIMEEFG